MAFFVPTALDPQSPVFRGRAAELARLTRLCLDEVNSYVVLYGGRQNGKTSLLFRLEAALRSASATTVCRLDFQLIKGATPERAFAFLAARIAESAPLAPDARGVQDGPTFQSFLNQLLGRADVGRLVLLLDELGALPAATREVLAHALRSLFHVRFGLPALKKLQILFSGGIELYNLVSTEASSLYNICDEVYLADLTQPEATELIAEGLRQLGVPDDDAAALGMAVYARAAGHPYLTQRLGSLLERADHAGQPLNATVLAEAERTLRSGDSLLRRIRDDLLEHALEPAARRLLTDPPRFTRLDDEMTRLELIGLAKPNGERWAPRNLLLADVFSERLGVLPAPPQPAAPHQTAPPGVAPSAAERLPEATAATPKAQAPAAAARPAAREPIATAPTPAPKAQHTQPMARRARSASLLVPELVHVPAGPFLMGSSDTDELAYADEKPQHQLELPDYWIGKTPITNAQFRPFVEGDGYRNQAYWIASGWQWRQAEKVIKPEFWDEATWNGAEYPVVGVSWFEAVAYCRWLSAQTGQEFRLPSEAEWEKAARGTDGRIWPWGNRWEAKRANSKEAGHGQTTPVGQYPAGASPYGALDMAGNVWEWCATKWGKPYPYQIEDEWQGAYLAATDFLVLRGGSWYNEQQYVRAPSRGSDLPRYRFDVRGLRVASHSRPDSGS
jgi:formylglycine-generating enzyme required for sulfatase activity